MPLYFGGTTTYVPRISPSIDKSVCHIRQNSLSWICNGRGIPHDDK